MKILVFGSLNIDYDYYMDHIVKPSETMSVDSMEIAAGGKGLNQSIAIAKSGADVYLAGNIGNNGQFLLDTLTKYGVKTELLNHLDEPNGHAIIQIDKNGSNSIFIYGGSNQSITTEYIDQVLAQFDAGDYLVMQNEINNQAYIMNKAYEKGMILFMNPSPISSALNEQPLKKVHYMFVNEVEGQALTGTDCPEEMLECFRKDYPDTAFILTLGSNGAYYQDCSERIYQASRKVKAVDTVGAGDTFMGYFTYALSAGMSPKQAIALSTKAAAITVTRKGAAQSIPTLAEIQEKDHD